MWEILHELASNSIIQLFFAVFSSVLSYEVLKSYYIRPKIALYFWNLQSKKRSPLTRQYKLKRRFPFITVYKIGVVDLPTMEVVLVIDNSGRSTAKNLSFFGWIPDTWAITLTKASFFKGGIIEVDEWEKEVDNLEIGNTAGNNSFRFIGDLPPTFTEYLKFHIPVPKKKLELGIVGENVGFHLISIRFK